MNLDELIEFMIDDVKGFLEAILLMTQYFYRKSINIAYEKFESQIMEIIYSILFKCNDHQMFSMMLELYRIKYF